MPSNEKLQSRNVQLETSAQALPSSSEELRSVNRQLTANRDELHRANADMRNLLESTQIATVLLDRLMIVRGHTPAIASIFSLTPDHGRPITQIEHRLRDVDLARDVEAVLEERKALERLVELHGGKASYLMRILPHCSAHDDVDGVLVTFVDVTALVEAEEQQRVLVSELNHRVRNMLQVVIGLANQSLHRSSDLKQFGKSFFGRMQALARAYELLSQDGWRKVTIAELLRAQLSPFATDEGRYSTHGEHFTLRPNTALAMGLVLYELATNATKYGALSGPAGRVHVEWGLETGPESNRQFVMRWRESGGPAVSSPTRHGFGSELLQRQLEYELNGTANMEFLESGLLVTIWIPAEEALEP